jgi:hypothetical protein
VRRRALLAGLGAAAAGCTTGYVPRDAAPGTGDTPTEPSDTPTGTPTDGAPLRDCEPANQVDQPGSAPADTEYRIADLAVESTTEPPEYRYVLEVDAHYSADAVERKAERDGKQVVRQLSEVESPAVREAVATALDEGEWRADRLPDGLAETVRRVDFFVPPDASGTYTHFGLALHRTYPNRPPAVVPEVRVLDPHVAPDDPGVVEFGLLNRAPEPREVFSGTVPPFGMLHAEAATDPGRFLLWRPYESEGCYFRTDEGWGACSIGKSTRLEPCERVRRTYSVLPSTTDHYPDLTVPSGPGRYRVEERVGHSAEFGGPSTTLSFTTTFQLREP